MVDVSLYSAADGRKQISGELVSLKDGIVTIEEEAGKDGGNSDRTDFKNQAGSNHLERGTVR